MSWRIIGEDEYEEGDDLFSSLFSPNSQKSLYKNYNIIKNAKLARINKTLFFPKLNSISYRPTNRILEFWGANGERPKIECYEEDFINAKINRNKLIIKDIEGREHEVEPICLKNVLDNSEVI